MDTNDLISLDLKHVWHPCSQMKDYEEFLPLPIVSARGSYLYTKYGKEIIDAISSWWCKSLGHAHPRILTVLAAQMGNFEHIIMANTCNETLVELSAKLAKICPPLDKVFYADNGSTAVEVAMKMSLQYHSQTGFPEKKNFAALKNGYHGESILTLVAGDCELYSKPFFHLFPEVPKLKPIPYIYGTDDPNWHTMPEDQWTQIEEMLDRISSTLSAILFEPIAQGAGGMKIYSPDLLRKLRNWADKNKVHLIADEIMTGFGRTGKLLACEHAAIIPDFIAISKGLTAGWGPMSAVLYPTEIYNAFYDDYASGKAFLHSNTYSGYPLMTAAALEAMKIYEDENIYSEVERKSCEFRRRMEWVAEETGALINIRSLGYIAAADIINPGTGKIYSPEKRMGFHFFQEAVNLGALLSPLGDTFYFFPPLNTDNETLDKLADIAGDALNKTIKNNHI